MAILPLPTLKELFTGKMFGSGGADKSKPGENVHPAVILVDRLVTEANDSLQSKKIDGDKNIKDWWLFCHRRYVGDHHDVAPQDELVQFTLNRDQVSILTNVAEQTQQPFTNIFTPVEYKDQPAYFLTRSGITQIQDLRLERLSQNAEAIALSPIIPPGLDSLIKGMSVEQLSGEEEISSSQVKKLKRFMETMILPDGQSVEPLLDTNAIVEINDSFRAERLQKLVELKWKDANGDLRMKMNELYCNIYGHAVSWCNIDERDWSINLRNVHPRNALADPVQFIIDDFHYCVITEMVSLHEAIGQWPQFKEMLVEASTTGTLENTEEPGAWHMGSVYGDTKFQRDMVVIRNAYIRDSNFPMEPKYAVQCGLVVEDGEGFKLAANDEPITPNDEAWPVKTGVRFIKTLPQIQQLIEDRMSKYDDIPVGWNLNIPIPFDHHGMGEPFRTKDVTDAINKSGEIIINYLLYYPYPCEIWPQDVLDSYADQGKEEPFTHPGRQWGIDGIHYQEYLKGNPYGFAVRPPDIPSIAAKVWDDFRAEHDVIAGRPDVRSGRAPGANTSGIAIDALMQKASGPVSFKASFTGDTVSRLGKIIGSYYAKYMPMEHWKVIFSDLTDAAVNYVFGKDAMSKLKFDVMCDVQAGLAANRERQMTKVLEDLNFGLINKEDARNIRGIANNSRQEQKIAREIRLANPQLQQQQQPTQPPTPQGTLQPMTGA